MVRPAPPKRQALGSLWAPLLSLTQSVSDPVQGHLVFIYSRKIMYLVSPSHQPNSAQPGAAAQHFDLKLFQYLCGIPGILDG